MYGGERHGIEPDVRSIAYAVSLLASTRACGPHVCSAQSHGRWAMGDGRMP